MKIIVTHRNADFDAVASLVAASMIYPDAESVIPKTVNPNVKAFMSIHKDIFDFKYLSEISLKSVSSLIVVDTNRWSRLERLTALKQKKDLEIILWDHHQGITDLNPSVSHIESRGANITILLKEIANRQIPLTPIQATLFLLGLYEDTGNLTFPSTTPEDAQAAAFLLGNKADLNILKTFLQPAYGEKQKEVLFAMIKDAKRIKIRQFRVSVEIREISGHVNSLSVVVNMFREILNVDAAFGIFVHKETGKCIVIGRSTISEIHVGNIMRALGGGGHPGAGSAMINEANPKSIKETIIELLRGNQETSVTIADIMSSPVVSVSPDMPMAEVAEVLRKKGCTGLPVIDGKKLVGVISRRDFKNRVKKEKHLRAPVKAFMSSPAVTVTNDKSPLYAARLMVKYDIGRLPVIDKKGNVVGIVSRSDAMRHFYHVLPD